MRVIQTISDLREARAAMTGSVGFVPTMGALHEGHLSLVRAAREENDCVIASIFVNPAQFGPAEDLDRYPRPFADDCAMLEAEGVGLVFAPAVEEIYPDGHEDVIVDVPAIGERLDGQSRRGHFRGVATIVTKLFLLVTPDRAYFGQKDLGQVAVISALVRSLQFPLEVVVCPIVRDDDGLALSSRNRYLTAEERTQALAFSRALRAVQECVATGVVATDDLQRLLQRELSSVHVDYAQIVDPQTLLPVAEATGGSVAAVAGWVGGTRLIDNAVLEVASAVLP